MSNEDLIAQENSNFLALMRKNGVNDPFEYKLERSTMQYAKSLVLSSDTLNHVPVPGLSRFEIKAAGLLKDLWLEFQITPSVDCDLGPFYTLVPFEKFEIRAYDRVIARIYPENIIDWYNSLAMEEQLALAKQTLVSPFKSTLTASTAITVRLPLPFSYFLNLRQSFFTLYTEPLKLHVQVQPQTILDSMASFSGGSGSITLSNMTLRQTFVIMHPSIEAGMLNGMRESDNGVGEAKLQWSVYKEDTVSVATGSTQVSISLECPYPTWRTLITIIPTANRDGTRPTQNFTSSLYATKGRLNTVVIKGSGIPLLNLTRDELLLQNGRHKILGYPKPCIANMTYNDIYGTRGGKLGDRTSDHMQFWVLQHSTYMENYVNNTPESAFEAAGLTQANARPWAHYADPRIELTFVEACDEGLDINVYHYYHQITQVDGDTGRITNTVLF